MNVALKLLSNDDLQVETVGSLFKQHRLKKNITIDQASSVLKIRPLFLDAIEKDEFDVLPGGVYTMGFIKNYASYLQLDIDNVMHKLNQQTVASQIKLGAVGSGGFSQNKPISKTYVFWSILLAILIGVISSVYFSEKMVDKQGTDKQNIL